MKNTTYKKMLINYHLSTVRFLAACKAFIKPSSGWSALVLTIFTYLIISTLSINSLYANRNKNRHVLTKKMLLNFSAPKGTNIDLYNKYGTIIINTWQKDSVVVEVVVEAKGKHKSDAQRILERVEVTHQQFRDNITVETEFGNNENEVIEWVKSLWQSAKNLVLDENNLQVNYTIYMPESANLLIENKFGDIVFGGDIYGDLDINLLHGNLKAEYIEGKTFMSMSFSKVSIDFIKNAEIDIKFGSLDLKEAEELKLRNISADTQIKRVQKLDINTRNARLNVADVDTLSGNSVFGKIDVGKVNHELSLDVQFGYLHIDSLPASLQLLELDAKSSDIEILIGQKSNYQLELVSQEKNLKLPSYLQHVDKKHLDNKNIALKALIGKQKTTKLIKINTDRGSLLIE